MIRVYSAIVAALFVVSSAHAADMASDARAKSGGSDNSDGGYFEFGVNLNLLINSDRADSDVVTLKTVGVLAGAYRYRRFFFEAFNPASKINDADAGVITLGVNIWRNDQWTVDLIGLSFRERFSRQTLRVVDSNSSNQELERALLNRNSNYKGAGVRLTGYFGNTIFQYRLENDSAGNGITNSARIGYSQQVKNWNFHGFVSANHLSQETGQYWYGVSEEEASARFPSYKVQASTMSYSGEIGASFPVRDNIVFRSATRYTQFADAIAKSPTQADDFEFSWTNSLSYVF